MASSQIDFAERKSTMCAGCWGVDSESRHTMPRLPPTHRLTTNAQETFALYARPTNGGWWNESTVFTHPLQLVPILHTYSVSPMTARWKSSISEYHPDFWTRRNHVPPVTVSLISCHCDSLPGKNYARNEDREGWDNRGQSRDRYTRNLERAFEPQSLGQPRRKQALPSAAIVRQTRSNPIDRGSVQRGLSQRAGHVKRGDPRVCAARRINHSSL